MSKLPEKYFDLRTRDRYIKKNLISKKDVESYLSDLPNDEDNFELSMFEDDDEIGLGEALSEEELQAMPEITEDNIDDFGFLEQPEDDDKAGEA